MQAAEAHTWTESSVPLDQSSKVAVTSRVSNGASDPPRVTFQPTAPTPTTSGRTPSLSHIAVQRSAASSRGPSKIAARSSRTSRAIESVPPCAAGSNARS